MSLAATPRPQSSGQVVFEFEARLDARGFDLALTLAPGETVAVLGPNGAGKSTLLALIAGLFEPDTGRATLGEDVLFDLGDGRHTFEPPHARSVSLLAQEPLLFPHLSVLDNVAFAPRSAGRSTRDARAVALRWLDEVDARQFATRRPHQLSGGQAQRIAVARALAAEPALLLLDEPLSALDIELAPAIRTMLRRVLQSRSALIVTHDVIDAYELADRVVVVDGGRVVESGPTRRVLEHPRSPFARQLLATNVVAGATGGRAAAAASTAARGTTGTPAAAESRHARRVRRLAERPRP